SRSRLGAARTLAIPGGGSFGASPGTMAGGFLVLGADGTAAGLATSATRATGFSVLGFGATSTGLEGNVVADSSAGKNGGRLELAEEKPTTKHKNRAMAIPPASSASPKAISHVRAHPGWLPFVEGDPVGRGN